jgi:hypothetical protein
MLSWPLRRIHASYPPSFPVSSAFVALVVVVTPVLAVVHVLVFRSEFSLGPPMILIKSFALMPAYLSQA